MNRYRTLEHPPMIFWETTPLCNHNCVHCFNYWRKDEVETSEINRINETRTYLEYAEKIISLRPANVVITGGEPLLIWSELKPCVELFKLNKCEVSMNTNAVLMTEEIAQFLKEHNIPLLISYPCSVEKICDEITDIPNSWKRINDGIKILSQIGNRFTCNMVVSRKNLSYVKETALFLKENFNLNHISLSRVGKPVNASEAFDGYVLRPQEIRQLLEISVEIQKEYGMSVEASAPYPICALETQEEYDIYAKRRLCSAGKSSYVIGSDGGIKACPRDSKIYGNVFEETFSEIWERLEEWRNGDLYPKECVKCTSFNECLGGCRADMLAENGHCKGLDSASRVERTPLKFKPKESKIVSFDADSEFCVSEELNVVKEGEGYRLSVKGAVAYVTKEAYDYLNMHRKFSICDFKREFIDGVNVEGIVNQLLKLHIITKINK